MSSNLSRRSRVLGRMAAVAAMAVLVLLVLPRPAWAQIEIHAQTWRDVHDALQMAQTTDEQIYIWMQFQFERREGDPDLLMRGGKRHSLYEWLSYRCPR